jgi:hypothetical protein
VCNANFFVASCTFVYFSIKIYAKVLRKRKSIYGKRSIDRKMQRNQPIKTSRVHSYTPKSQNTKGIPKRYGKYEKVTGRIKKRRKQREDTIFL